MICQSMLDRYRCSPALGEFRIANSLSEEQGYFTFGRDTICYGRYASTPVSGVALTDLHDTWQYIKTDGPVPTLPFDPDEVITNLRLERYPNGDTGLLQVNTKTSAIYKAYYLVRPLLGVHARKYLQRLSFRGWQNRAFPNWPVDLTVERLLEKCLMLTMKSHQFKAVPFIWFWPDGHQCCGSITHDVETAEGQRFCSNLMDMDDDYGMKASFQVIPEERYVVSQQYLDNLWKRGFEVNVQDLNHDGKLFWDHEEFRRRAVAINSYARTYGAAGFRAGALYRNAEWYEALDISYDMSIPNCAHLDPQRGGCCTVFPYFIGNILELPVTTAQDYSVFHIIGDYSIELWKRQIGMIRAANGLASIIVHPDYVIDNRARQVYETLLEYLSAQRDERGMWIALPSQVNTWWRQRSSMSLVCENGNWRIEGAGSERARVAYAHL
jgi:hypothetical protein